VGVCRRPEVEHDLVFRVSAVEGAVTGAGKGLALLHAGHGRSSAHNIKQPGIKRQAFLRYSFNNQGSYVVLYLV